NPTIVEVWNDRGSAHAFLGQWESAIADCSRALEIDPKHWNSWYSRGYAHMNCNQLDRAFADFSMSIELNPKFQHAWLNRGNVHLQSNRLDQAVADYSKAVELDPQFALAWCNRGRAHKRQGLPDKAIADLTKAIDMAPNQPHVPKAYWERAQAHILLDQWEQARSDYQSLLKRMPNTPVVLNELAWLLAACPDEKVRDPDRAVELAGKAVQLEPNEATNWDTLGVAQYRAGAWKAASKALDQSLKLAKDGDAVGRFVLAMAQRKLGNPVEANKAYEQA